MHASYIWFKPKCSTRNTPYPWKFSMRPRMLPFYFSSAKLSLNWTHLYQYSGELNTDLGPHSQKNCFCNFYLNYSLASQVLQSKPTQKVRQWDIIYHLAVVLLEVEWVLPPFQLPALSLHSFPLSPVSCIVLAPALHKHTMNQTRERIQWWFPVRSVLSSDLLQGARNVQTSAEHKSTARDWGRRLF